MRMKAVAVIFVGLVMLAGSAHKADATPMMTTNPLAISGPDAVLINFEDLAGSHAEITDYYSALGLTISGGLHPFTTGLPASFGSVAATNGGTVPAPDITFGPAPGETLSAFGFDLFTLGPSATTFVVSAFTDGVETLHQTFTFSTGGEPKFIGVVETDPTKWFDSIVVSSQAEIGSTAAFAIDNIRLVPEPGTLSLMVFGAFGLLSASRRRKKS